MSETAASEAPEEMTLEDLQGLVESTARNICEAFQGVPLVAHLGVARRLVELVTLDMASRGYVRDALGMLQQLDADIVQFHNTIVQAAQGEANDAAQTQAG